MALAKILLDERDKLVHVMRLETTEADWCTLKRPYLKLVLTFTTAIFYVPTLHLAAAFGEDLMFRAYPSRTQQSGGAKPSGRVSIPSNKVHLVSQTPPARPSIARKEDAVGVRVNHACKAALVMNAVTGEVLIERNPQEVLLPASLTKMMLMLISLDRLEKGQVSLADQVMVSKRASLVGGSSIFLRAGEVIPFGDLMKAVLIPSANDAAEAVAEYLGKTVENFVERMNLRARELGMKDTIFYNVHGLPSGNGKDNISTVYDMAILAAELIKYPQILQWSSQRRARIRNGTYVITNTNKLLGWFPGLDGLKTGYYRRAGFNMAATARRGDLRLIAVVMGAATSRARFEAAKDLLSNAFENYQELNSGRKVASQGSSEHGFPEYKSSAAMGM
jgi:D-alanyl-D-alanine carboxypeptidase